MFEYIQITYKFIPQGELLSDFDIEIYHICPYKDEFWNAGLTEYDKNGLTKEEYVGTYDSAWSDWEGGYYKAPEDWHGFKFEWVGEKLGEDLYFGSIQYFATECEYLDAFAPFLEDLKDLGTAKLRKANKKLRENVDNFIRKDKITEVQFLTQWNCSSGTDGFGESWEDYDLIGEFELPQI